MPNEFIARNGLIALNNTTVSGSFIISGSVGIGTNNPTSPLHISSTNGNVINATSTAAQTYITFTDSAGYRGYMGTAPGGFILVGNAGMGVYFYVNGSPSMNLSSTGNLGVNMGNIVGSARLHISGASSDNLLRIDSPASSSILFVTGSGNVGIGTNNPTSRLQVGGTSNGSTSFDADHTLFNGVNARFPGRIIVGASSTQYPKIMYNAVPLSSSNSWSYAVGDTAWAINMGGSNRMSFEYVGSGTGGNIFSTWNTIMTLVSGSGNVGIGTITPTSLLQVAGRITSTELYVTNGDAIYTTNGSVGIGTSGPTSTNRLQVRGSGATSATTTFLLQNSTPVTLMTVLDNGQFIYTSPTMSLAASQSAYTISPIISASNLVGGQFYGVNITPTFYQTTGSQVETAFRVAATFTQSSAAATSGSNIIADFGATSVGSQLTVTDVTSGSIYMVNDVSGLPIIEATSDWTVNMYNFPNIVFQKTGSNINITGSLRVTGSLVMSPTSSFVFPLSQSVSPLTGSAYWSGSLLFIWDGSRYRSSSFA